MIYKFTIISEEVEGFVRDIQIDSEASFLDLHQSIFTVVNYTKINNAAFYLCDEYWDKKNEVLLEEISDNPEYDTWLMEETTLDYFLEEEHQRLIHIFDMEHQRGFHIRLTEIIPGKSLSEPKYTRSKGNAPEQFISEEDITSVITPVDLDEDFYGSQDFDLEDLASFESREDSDI